MLRAVLASALVALVTLSPRIALADTCSQDRMEGAPESTLGACTALLDTDLSPKDRAEAFYVRGRSHHRTGRPDLARPDYDAALALTPDDARIYVDRANTHFRDNDYQAGVDDLTRALEIDPRHARALRAYATILNHMGREAEALAFYKKALDANPAEGLALLFRSKLHSKRKDFQKAFEDADALVAIPSEILDRQGYVNEERRFRKFHAVALIHRAELHARTGDQRSALQDLDRAVDHVRGGDEYLERGEFLAELPDRRADAIRDLDEAARLLPLSHRVHSIRGQAYLGLKSYDEAFRAFDRAIALHPGDAHSLWMRARMHRQFGRTDDAVEDLMAAVSLNRRIFDQTVNSLRYAGYWTSEPVPESMTPALSDAFRACMIDLSCN